MNESNYVKIVNEQWDINMSQTSRPSRNQKNMNQNWRGKLKQIFTHLMIAEWNDFIAVNILLTKNQAFRKYSTCWVLKKSEEPCRILKKFVHACVVNVIHAKVLPGSVLYIEHWMKVKVNYEFISAGLLQIWKQWKSGLVCNRPWWTVNTRAPDVANKWRRPLASGQCKFMKACLVICLNLWTLDKLDSFLSNRCVASAVLSREGITGVVAVWNILSRPKLENNCFDFRLSCKWGLT